MSSMYDIRTSACTADACDAGRPCRQATQSTAAAAAAAARCLSCITPLSRLSLLLSADCCHRKDFRLVFIKHCTPSVCFLFGGFNAPMALKRYAPRRQPFLADRTIGRAYGTVCRLSVCLSVCRLSSVTFCIVAKRCVLAKKCLKEQKGNQGQRVDFLGRRHISTSSFAYMAT